ncbi:MAG: hypothetical protein WC956_10485, partial [bacterium]
HPAILLNGYLKKQGEESPVRNEALLIADIPPEIQKKLSKDGGGGAPTNSNLQLPKSPVRFSNGDIPPHAFIAPPQNAQQAVQPNYRGRAVRSIYGSSLPGSGRAEPAAPPPAEAAIPLPLIRTYDDYRKNPDGRVSEIEMKYRLSVKNRDEWFFRDKADAARFEQLEKQHLKELHAGKSTAATERAISEFHYNLWYRQANEGLHKSEYDQIEKLFSGGFFELHKMQPDQLEALKSYLSFITRGTFAEAPDSLQRKDRAPDNQRILNLLPRLQRLAALHEAFANRVRQNPEVLLLYLEQHPEVDEDGRVFLGQFYSLSPQGTRFEKAWMGNYEDVFAAALLLPDRVTYREERQGQKERTGQRSREAHIQRAAQPSARLMEQSASETNPDADAGGFTAHDRDVSSQVRPFTAPDVDLYPREEIARATKNPGRGKPLKLSPNPRAKVKIGAMRYMHQLRNAMSSNHRGFDGPEKLARLWTRDMSKLFLESVRLKLNPPKNQFMMLGVDFMPAVLYAAGPKRENEPENRAPIRKFYNSASYLYAYRAISDARPASELTFPGPRGGNVPEDIAILLRNALQEDIFFFHVSDDGYTREEYLKKAEDYLKKVEEALKGKTQID